MPESKILLTVGFLCLLEWGLIHIFAGGITVYLAYQPDIPALLAGICSGAPAPIVEEASTIATWNAMNVRILIQHGLNLLFVGVWSTVLAFVLMFAPTIPSSLFVMCLWPWCADIAYFWAIDTVNYGVLLTEAQTIVISIGTLCVGLLVKEQYKDLSALHSFAIYFFPFFLISCSLVNKVIELTSKKSEYQEL